MDINNRGKGQTLIYLLFFFSGISGLVYQTVWLRILGRVMGNTIYATAVVVGTFMAGLALGSFLIGRIADRHKKPLRLYAILELWIGVSALLLFFLFDRLTPLYRFIYASFGEERIILTLFQAILLFIILLIPTSLMGGTLPVLTAYTGKGGSIFSARIGNLYGLNTLGAVVGVVGSGLVTIGAAGEFNTVLTGIVINFLVALIAFSLVKEEKEDVEDNKIIEKKEQKISPYSSPVRKFVLLAYGINGFCAIACEIVWTRLLQLPLGTSIYAFSMMLGIYLLGIAAGSIAGARFINRLKDPLAFFGLAQAFIALYSILGMYLYTLFTPSWETINVYNIISVPVVIVFPITFILGLVFPAVSGSYVEDERNAGTGVGRLYSVNTLGAIAGSLFCGFLLTGFLGTRGTIIFLAGLNIVTGIFSLLFSSGSYKNLRYTLLLSFFTVLSLVLAVLSPDPFISVIKKEIKERTGPLYSDIEIYYHKENTVATTTAFGLKSDPLMRQLWINGTGMTHLCLETKLMAHLPFLLHKGPEDMLIICFGMGTTLRSALIHKNLRCDTVEIVPEVYDCFKYFHRNSDEIINDSRVNTYRDDGRNFLLMRDKSYDIITLDPSPPLWSSGTVNLYSGEFFELCRERLKPGGILCLWVPPAPLPEVKMIMMTFYSVFPCGTVWSGVNYPGFYLIGTEKPLEIDVERFKEANKDEALVEDLNEWARFKITEKTLKSIEDRLEVDKLKPFMNQEFSRNVLAENLKASGFNEKETDLIINQGTEWNKFLPLPENMLSLYVFTSHELAEFAGDSLIIRDNNPYTEFPFWRQLFNPESKVILTTKFLYEWKQNNL